MEKIIKKYRVLRNTRNPDNEIVNEMVNGENECKAEYYFSNQVSLWDKDKLRSCTFDKSDVAELTPLSFNGKSIAIGDTLNRKYVVYGYYWLDGEWRLNTVQNNSCFTDCRIFRKAEIFSHTPQGTTTETIEIAGHKYNKAEVEKALKDLKEIK